MALLSDLVRIIADVEGLEEVSVGFFARQAREAGYISQGGRGRSAAKMTVSDAANLLIAVNGCSLAKEVPRKVKLIRSLAADKKNQPTAAGIGGPRRTFGDDLEHLIDLFVQTDDFYQLGALPGATFVRFYRPDLMAEIEMKPYVSKKHIEEKISYGLDQLGYTQNAADRSDETVISHVTLRAVARSL